MTKLILSSVLLFSFFICTNGQRIDKPTLTPKPCTDSQTLVIQQGVGLHDQKDFDGAIAKFNKVLQENPDCTTALYELSLSYYQKNDKTKAMETAYKGSKYRSNDLPLLQARACPYPDLAEQDRSVCSMERMMFSELVGENLRLSNCRLDGHNCCTFEPVVG